MEEQQKTKSATPAAKVRERTAKAAAAQLTDLSVRPSGKRAAKGADQAMAGPITAEQRRQLIAQAAYYRALSRGFAGGDPIADWLEAEREVDKSLAGKAD